MSPEIRGSQRSSMPGALSGMCDHAGDLSQGTYAGSPLGGWHRLQWEDPAACRARAALRIGPPQPCTPTEAYPCWYPCFFP